MTVLRKKHFSSHSSSHSSATTFIASSERLSSLFAPRWTDEFVAQIKHYAATDPDYQAQVTADNRDVGVTIKDDGLLYRKERLWVPAPLQKAILESEHDTKVAGHMGIDKTLELITRNFWWPGIARSVRDYVRSCYECQRNKAPRHAPAGLLQPLELHYTPWQSVAMDFITDLPVSNGCDSIWVMVDPFTKMAHFVPLQIDGKKTDDLIRLFAWHYWRLHGIPQDIISDRDSCFTSRLWKDFLKLVGIKPRMSTAFHPQTDGQTERTNQTLEAYLRAFVNYEMSNWEDLLPTAEFAYNNAPSASTGLSPFFANYGYHPSAHNPPAEPRARNPASQHYAHWMTQVYDDTRKRLEKSRVRMKEWADKRRNSLRTYAVGQLVMLNARHLKTRCPTRKFDHKMVGPFRVLSVISPMAVRLDLPKKWRIHNSFHVSLLEPYRTGLQEAPDPDQIMRDAEPVEAEDYEIDEVKDSIYVEGDVVKYLVKWEGWPARKYWTWEPFEHFYHPEPLSAFHRKFPDKPRDARVPKDTP